MNFDYSEEQRLLQQEARKFLTDNSDCAAVRRVLNDAEKSFDDTLWSSVAELGWLGAIIPECYGGLGLDATDLCAISEELGRAITPIPFSSTVYLFTQALLLAGSEEQRTSLLPKIAEGNLIGCLATSEGPGVRTIEARVERGQLNGLKLPVTDGDIADFAIVLASDTRGCSLYLADLRAGGVQASPLATLDPSRGAAELKFSNTPVERLGDAGNGHMLVQQIFDRAAIFIAFEQIGGSDAVMEMARDYAVERYAFGRPIGSFQAIKHRIANMYVRNQIARSNCYYGAWALEAQSAELPKAAAAARVSANEAFRFSAKESIEVFGGIGTTWEADCHLFYRRAKQLALAVGPTAVWRERLATELERVTTPTV
jgi:alkylation response protein AidB-like acyl-CoA dehydrogenase